MAAQYTHRQHCPLPLNVFAVFTKYPVIQLPHCSVFFAIQPLNWIRGLCFYLVNSINCHVQHIILSVLKWQWKRTGHKSDNVHIICVSLLMLILFCRYWHCVAMALAADISEEHASIFSVPPKLWQHCPLPHGFNIPTWEAGCPSKLSGIQATFTWCRCPDRGAGCLWKMSENQLPYGPTPSNICSVNNECSWKLGTCNYFCYRAKVAFAAWLVPHIYLWIMYTC